MPSQRVSSNDVVWCFLIFNHLNLLVCAYTPAKSVAKLSGARFVNNHLTFVLTTVSLSLFGSPLKVKVTTSSRHRIAHEQHLSAGQKMEMRTCSCCTGYSHGHARLWGPTILTSSSSSAGVGAERMAQRQAHHPFSSSSSTSSPGPSPSRSHQSRSRSPTPPPPPYPSSHHHHLDHQHHHQHLNHHQHQHHHQRESISSFKIPPRKAPPFLNEQQITRASHLRRMARHEWGYAQHNGRCP